MRIFLDTLLASMQVVHIPYLFGFCMRTPSSLQNFTGSDVPTLRATTSLWPALQPGFVPHCGARGWIVLEGPIHGIIIAFFLLCMVVGFLLSDAILFGTFQISSKMLQSGISINANQELSLMRYCSYVALQ